MKDLARPVPFEFGNHPQQKIPKVSHDSASIHAPLQNASREVGFSFGSIRSFKRDTSPGRSAREYKRFQLDQNSFRISPFYQNLTERQHYYHHRKHLRFQRMKDDKYDDDGNASTSSFVSARSSPSETSHATNDSKSSIDSLISRLDAVSLDTEKLLKEHEPRLRNDAYLVFTKNYIRIRQKAQNVLDTYLDRGLDLDEEYEKTAIPEPRAVKPLTDEEKEMVRGVMKKGQNGEMARLKTAIVEYKDIYKLYPETWLNDEIINFYMELISDRANSENSNLPSVHCFNTFFCSTLREHGYAKVRRWTKRVDIFAKDLIFIPINYSYHWTLGVIDMRNKTIRIYDSLHGHHDSTLRLLLSYLEDEHMDKKKEPIDLSDWQIDAPKDIPRQGNMSDCGVFTCTFAERLSRQQSFDFSQRDMEIIRQRMVLSIIHKSIQ